MKMKLTSSTTAATCSILLRPPLPIKQKSYLQPSKHEDFSFYFFDSTPMYLGQVVLLLCHFLGCCLNLLYPAMSVSAKNACLAVPYLVSSLPFLLGAKTTLLRTRLSAAAITLWAIQHFVVIEQQQFRLFYDDKGNSVDTTIASTPNILNEWATAALLGLLFTLPHGLGSTSSHPGTASFTTIGSALFIMGWMMAVMALIQRMTVCESAAFCEAGLWFVSQHPHYFGDIIQWIGICWMHVPALIEETRWGEGKQEKQRTPISWQYRRVIAAFLFGPFAVSMHLTTKANRLAKFKQFTSKQHQHYDEITPVLIPSTTKCITALQRAGTEFLQQLRTADMIDSRLQTMDEVMSHQNSQQTFVNTSHAIHDAETVEVLFSQQSVTVDDNLFDWSVEEESIPPSSPNITTIRSSAPRTVMYDSFLLQHTPVGQDVVFYDTAETSWRFADFDKVAEQQEATMLLDDEDVEFEGKSSTNQIESSTIVMGSPPEEPPTGNLGDGEVHLEEERTWIDSPAAADHLEKNYSTDRPTLHNDHDSDIPIEESIMESLDDILAEDSQLQGLGIFQSHIDSVMQQAEPQENSLEHSVDIDMEFTSNKSLAMHVNAEACPAQQLELVHLFSNAVMVPLAASLDTCVAFQLLSKQERLFLLSKKCYSVEDPQDHNDKIRRLPAVAFIRRWKVVMPALVESYKNESSLVLAEGSLFQPLSDSYPILEQIADSQMSLLSVNNSGGAISPPLHDRHESGVAVVDDGLGISTYENNYASMTQTQDSEDDSTHTEDNETDVYDANSSISFLEETCES